MTRTRVVSALILILLAIFYCAAAKEHGIRVNVSKARGDQSGYLWDAENVYANWHGRQPPILIGERNRMPVYAGFLALAYRPTMTDLQFFEVAKRRNTYLSLFLLALLYPIFRRFLPRHAAFNLLLLTAFGWFIFRAAYVQAELLFDFLFFVAFVLMLQLVRASFSWTGTCWRALAAGAVAAVAHLTKAAMVPIVGIAVVVLAAQGLAAIRARAPGSLRRLAAAALVAAGFLAVLSPYLMENKRTFGRYFYNVNTTFYIWYDDWPQASGGTILHGDGVGWPTLPASELPSASRYWREHSVNQIAARVGGGLVDIVQRSYTTFRYLPYLTAYLLLAGALVIRNRAAAAALARSRPWPLLFLGAYATVYLLGIAFYAPVSGTGTTRFLMAHLLPAFFVLSLWISRERPRASTTWRLGGTELTLAHFHLFISVWLAFEIVFTVWPRMMTTYSGF